MKMNWLLVFIPIVVALEHVKPEAAVFRGESQLARSYQIDGEVVFEKRDAQRLPRALKETVGNFASGGVAMVQNPPLRVTALPSEI